MYVHTYIFIYMSGLDFCTNALGSLAGGQVTSVKFDYSGQYLAVGGADARVYGVKSDWSLLSTLADLPTKVKADLADSCVHML